MEAPAYHRTGEIVDLLNIRPEDVDFRAIELTLRAIRRYAGNSDITVWDHTCLAVAWASKFVPEDLFRRVAPFIWLHDAHEAFIGDLTRPLVRALDIMHPETSIALANIKFDIDRAIRKAANLYERQEDNFWWHEAITRADAGAQDTERRHFLLPTDKQYWKPTNEYLSKGTARRAMYDPYFWEWKDPWFLSLPAEYDRGR